MGGYSLRVLLPEYLPLHLVRVLDFVLLPVAVEGGEDQKVSLRRQRHLVEGLSDVVRIVRFCQALVDSSPAPTPRRSR